MANIRKWSSIVWLTVITVLVIYSLNRQPLSVLLLNDQIDVTVIVVSLSFILIGKLLTIALVWFSLRSAGEDRGWKFSWRAYSLADISKYIPGGIWGIAGRLAIYSQAGIGLSKSVRLLLAETGVIVFFSLVTGGAVLILVQYVSEIPVLMLGFLVGSVALFFAIYIAFPQLSFGLRCLATLSTAISWIFFGLSFAIVIAPNFELFFEFAGRHNVGFAAGQIAVFAPSGIGVREFVISWLSRDPSEDMRLTIEYVVIHRLIWIVADIIILIPVLIWLVWGNDRTKSLEAAE